REGERRNVSDNEACADLPQHARLRGGARDEVAVERGRAPDAVRLVERQTVDLDDAGVGLEMAERDPAFDGEIEQPPRGRGADPDTRFGTPGEDGVDHLDHARRVAEAVTRHVEDDGVRQWAAGAGLQARGPAT